MVGMRGLSVGELQKISYELDQPIIDLNKIGPITREGRWSHIVNGILYRLEPRYLLLINKVNETFARVEEKGVKIFDVTADPENFARLAEYQKSHEIYFTVVQQIKTAVRDLVEFSPSLARAFHELLCREVGLRYSLGEENGGLDSLKEGDATLLATITEEAENWKKKQKLAVDCKLNAWEKIQLEEMAKYPEWLEIVVEDPTYLNDVFNWCLRDFNQVEVIVKCYETRLKLKEAFLSANLGYTRNPLLIAPEDDVLAFSMVKTRVDGVSKRVLTVPVYHGSCSEFDSSLQERVNILDPSHTIHFSRGNYTLTVEEFLHELAQKHVREANITLCAHWGFVNFHPVNGVWNPSLQKYEMPELSKDDWINEVPAAKIVSHEELVCQYGEEVENRDFFFKVMATRQNLNLNALNAHAFWGLYLKMEDGRWRVLNIGLYAERFQQGFVDGLTLLCATLHRVVCLSDQNGYYTQRQRGGISIFPSEEEKEKLLNNIHRLIHREGVFQFAGRNCAYGIQRQTTRALSDSCPNFYKIPATRTETGVKPLDALLSWADGKWEWLQAFLVKCIHTLFFSSRSILIKRKDEENDQEYSVNEYFSSGNLSIYNPSWLPYQIAEAKETKVEGSDSDESPFATGELTWGNTDEKLPILDVIRSLREHERERVGVEADSEQTCEVFQEA